MNFELHPSSPSPPPKKKEKKKEKEKSLSSFHYLIRLKKKAQGLTLSPIHCFDLFLKWKFTPNYQKATCLLQTMVEMEIKDKQVLTEKTERTGLTRYGDVKVIIVKLGVIMD